MAIRTLINAGSFLVAGLLLVGVIVATNWYLKGSADNSAADASAGIASSNPAPAQNTPQTPAASGTVLAAAELPASTAPLPSNTLADTSADTQSPVNTPEIVSSQNPLSEYIDFTTLGDNPLSDDELKRLADALANDPALREQLLAEFRANTDPERVRVLVWLIGQFGEEQATQIGGELIFSGDPVSQQAGLTLLGELQPRVDAAREMVASLVMIEPNTEVLVSALDALARPGELPQGSQEQLTNRFVELSTHDDTRMRARAVALLGRWSADANVTGTLVDSTRDTQADVRRNAVYALAQLSSRTTATRDALLAVIQNSDEVAETRQGAINAIKKYSLDSDQQAIVDDINVELQRPR